jgi:hypothetical protein
MRNLMAHIFKSNARASGRRAQMLATAHHNCKVKYLGSIKSKYDDKKDLLILLCAEFKKEI